MKNSISFIAILLIVCLLVCICTSCIFRDYATTETEDLFKHATYTNLDGSKTKPSKKHSENEGIIIKLKDSYTLNTIVLGENKKGLKSNITNFTLSYLNESDEWTEFYTQDLVEEYRYCVFEPIKTSQIKLVVNETEENRKWNLNKISGHMVTKTYRDDFRVMGYAVAGFAYNGIKDPKIFDVITHINVFQHIYLKQDGTIFFGDKTIKKDGQDVVIPGEEYFAQEMQNIITARGDKTTNIIATILPDPGAGMDPESLHTPAFKDHSDKIIEQINALFDKYPELDGIAFDYEYPYSGSANKVFGNFVKKLKTNMPDDKTLALALSVWQFKAGLFPHDALEFVDMVEMMAYDQFDERGYHSTFQFSMVNIVNELTRYGLKKYLPKINLGVPFYSRPTDGSLYWGDYNIDNDLIGKNNNIVKPSRPINKVITWNPYVEEPLENPVLYYNSPQMIYDKTAYCIDNNLGGMMIWHLGCDISMDDENSLLRTIGNAIESRK